MNSLFTDPKNIRLFDSSLSEFTILKLIVSLPLVFLISLFPLKKELTSVRTIGSLIKNHKVDTTS